MSSANSKFCCSQRLISALLAGIMMATAPVAASTLVERERLAEAQGDRLKDVHFNSTYGDVCPTLTALIDSVAGKFRLLIPQHETGATTKLYLVKEQLSNAMRIAFETRQCRYILTVRRFTGSADAETEVPILPRFVGPAWKVSSDVPWLVERTLSPFDGGFTRYSIPFDVNDDLTFSGAIYFASDRFTVYLVNVPKDLRMTSHDNSEFRTYDVFIAKGNARLSLALTREIINPDGTWRNVFGP